MRRHKPEWHREHHETQPETHPGFQVHVDKGIAELLRLCWRRGFATRWSCEGHDGEERKGWGRAYVEFQSTLEAALFAAVAGPMSWTREEHEARRLERPQNNERWTYDWHIGGIHHAASNVVSFPKRDIARAMAALRRAGRWTITEMLEAASQAREQKAAPRRCRTCRSAIAPWVRKDARYCTRRCQLRGRRRGMRG